MTRDDVMKMDDRELISGLTNFLRPLGNKTTWVRVCIQNMGAWLYLCYQAEEKIREMGLESWVRWGITLRKVVNESYGGISHGTEDFYHAHPRDRARSILLTINDEEAPND